MLVALSLLVCVQVPVWGQEPGHFTALEGEPELEMMLLL
jgi:hypothetical protein